MILLLSSSSSLFSIVQEGNGDDSNWTTLYDLEEPQSMTVSPRIQDEESKGEEKQFQNRDGMKILPFEFVALEACLEAACGVLETEVHIFFSFAHFPLFYSHFLYIDFSAISLCRQRHWRKRLILPWIS